MASTIVWSIERNSYMYGPLLMELALCSSLALHGSRIQYGGGGRGDIPLQTQVPPLDIRPDFHYVIVLKQSSNKFKF